MPQTELRPLRGRRRERALISAGLERVAGGSPATFVLVGEPGIGKSRLASEAADLAAQSGLAVRWGRAWEAGGAPAYWPWRQLCDGLARSGAMAQLWAARGASAADPDQARFDVFDAVTRALAGEAEAKPLLCILDDLHAADTPSLELLAFATRHLRASRIAWLLTWRDAEAMQQPVRDPLARVAREATVVPLTALSDVDANELIDDVRHDIDIAMRERVVRATGGNPLFLLETLAAVGTGHDVRALPLAQGIATLVHDRMAPLSPECRQIAVAAAVVGRDVSLAAWSGAASADFATIRRAATSLVKAGVLDAVEPDRWRFGHDLVREAIYREAGDDVLDLHARLAHWLDAAIAAGDASLVGARAHHALAARLDPRTVIAWTIAAADHARAQCAYEEALAVIDRTAARIPQRDGALQLARGRALLDLGQTREAHEVFSGAIALGEKAKDPELVAAAVLGLGARYVFGDNLHELIAMIDRAAAALPDDKRELHARLLARKAAALTPAADPEPVLAIARQALALVADSPDDAAQLDVAVAAGAAMIGFAHPRESARVSELVIAKARTVGDRALELRGLSRLVVDHLQLGELARADAVLATHDALARALVQPRFAWLGPLFRSMRAMLTGELAGCDALVAEAERIGKDAPNAARACAIHRTWLYLAADRVADLRAHEPIVLDAIRTMEPILAAVIRAAIHARAGELADARREVDALDVNLSHGRAPIILCALAEVICETGPESLQREVYDLLAPAADTYAAFPTFGPSMGPPIAAMLGCLAAALGEPERARAHFDSALMMSTAAGARVARAWTSYWYGRALARFEDPDAARLLDDAQREATSLGIVGLAERARAVTPTKQHAPRPAATQAFAWSMTEQAGSWLVAVGDKRMLAPNLRGMPMLARLVANPHVEVHSLELVSGAVEPEDTGDAGELLDDKARAAYRKRVAKLADEIEEAEARGDVARAEAARDEHEQLVKELARAIGLGGKPRRAGSGAERARVAAHRNLREAIKKLGELDAALGEHLAKAIRTGTFCAYRP